MLERVGRLSHRACCRRKRPPYRLLPRIWEHVLERSSHYKTTRLYCIRWPHVIFNGNLPSILVKDVYFADGKRETRSARNSVPARSLLHTTAGSSLAHATAFPPIRSLWWNEEERNTFALQAETVQLLYCSGLKLLWKWGPDISHQKGWGPK